jgi:dipeptidase E
MELFQWGFLDKDVLPGNTSRHAADWAKVLQAPACAIDDETAIRVKDGKVDVISEGNWKKFF